MKLFDFAAFLKSEVYKLKTLDHRKFYKFRFVHRLHNLTLQRLLNFARLPWFFQNLHSHSFFEKHTFHHSFFDCLHFISGRLPLIKLLQLSKYFFRFFKQNFPFLTFPSRPRPAGRGFEASSKFKIPSKQLFVLFVYRLLVDEIEKVSKPARL